jgi:membrane fusion protein, epimerase transport system
MKRAIEVSGGTGRTGLSGPSDSARGSIVAGVAILAVFFGVLGTWAFLAPLNAAIVGEAVVKVEGNRKSVQHLDGGIVRELRVAEGDRVEVGDILIVLDDTAVVAERDVLAHQQAVLVATEARLNAELAGVDTIAFPSDLVADRSDPTTGAALAVQEQEFDIRRATLAGEVGILEKRIAQLEEQIAGHRARAKANRQQLASVREELLSLEQLFAAGYITKPRLLQLERTATGLEGDIASTEASIAGARENIAELERQIEQLRKARNAETAAALTDVRARLFDIEPRLQNATTVLGRLEIRAPYSGQIVDLDVHSVGAVIGRGDRILDIVPDEGGVMVEARIGVTDIAELRPGMRAEIHLASYGQSRNLLVHGTIRSVSADALVEPRTGEPYYLAEVEVDPLELAGNLDIRLYPGMPATVMVTTRERTAFDYLVGPLAASLHRSFRQP